MREGVESFGREEGGGEVMEGKYVSDCVGVGVVVSLVEGCGEGSVGVEPGLFIKDDGLSGKDMLYETEDEDSELGLTSEDDATEGNIYDDVLELDGETVGLESED